MLELPIYKNNWSPYEGKVPQLQREPSNPKDKFTVIICPDGQVVAQVPTELARIFSLFLAREFNSITATITGVRVNHGAGLGFEVSIQRFMGIVKKKKTQAIQTYMLVFCNSY